jgi:hypothetical protein
VWVDMTSQGGVVWIGIGMQDQSDSNILRVLSPVS